MKTPITVKNGMGRAKNPFHKNIIEFGGGYYKSRMGAL